MESYDGAFKILLLSEPEVDKSVMIWGDIYRFDTPNERYIIGVEVILKIMAIDDKRYKLQLWDFNGEKRFRGFITQWYPGANATVLFYDVNRSKTLDNIDEWVNIIREKCGEIPIMLVGLISDEKGERQVSAEAGKKITKLRNLSGYFECNPETGENVEKALEGLTRLILVNRSFTPPQKKAEDFSKPNYLMKKKRLDSESDFKSRSKINSPKTPSKNPSLPSPPKPPENPELSSFEFSGARWISCPSCRRKIAVADFKNHTCMGTTLDTERTISQLSSSVKPRVNINSQLKSEVQSFLEWIKDNEGLSGYITYYLQQNNSIIISELSKIYADLREIFGV